MVLRTAWRAIAPFLLGSLGILAWNFAVGQVLFALGVGPEPGPQADRSSFTTADWVVRLGQTTLAGVVGALLCTRVAHSHPMRHMIAFTIIWLALDVLSMTLGGAGVPLWVKATALMLVPPQLYAGYRLGLLWRGRAKRAAAASP